MIILAIETSCDETSIAILEAKNSRFRVLSNIVSSQVKIHRKWGGVVPSLAKREHQNNLTLVLKKAISEAKMLRRLMASNRKTELQLKIKKLQEILIREEKLFRRFEKFSENYQKPKIDLIAVTAAHGLEPALWVGVNFAKALAFFWQKPILPVHHVEAHIFANWLLPAGANFQEIKFPAVCLVVSGGHTGLILMKGIGKYKLLGETRDDAAGECFDKVARVLSLGYPGGPVISKIAEQKNYGSSTSINYSAIKLPRPMIYQKNYDFSFSGLKTAVLYDFKGRSPKIRQSKKYIGEMCYETQQAIIDVLIYKTTKAAKEYKAKSIILGGGVVANTELRKQFKERILKEIPNTKYKIPDTQYCTDNAAMTAVAAYFHRKEATEDWRKIKVNANLKIPELQ